MAGAEFGEHLCLAPGSTVPAEPDKSPAHHISPCALCSGIHAVGGFVPPSAPVIAVSRDYGVAIPTSVFIFLPREWFHSRQQPRGPPILV
jgi:hypothetical protein